MIRFELPTIDDLIRLGQPTPNAVTVYLPTSPTPAGREQAITAAKSRVDEAIRRLRSGGAPVSAQEAIRGHWDALADNSTLWGKLSRSLAIFLAPEVSEEYVLPNSLEPQVQAGEYFNIGQLVRSVTTPQSAYALTLSSNGWNLWEASEASRATELELGAEYATDAAEAAGRASRGKDHPLRLAGAEVRKGQLERYSKMVADALRAELGQRDPGAAKPVFVFAVEPLLSMMLGEELPWQRVAVPGAPDNLRPDQIDEAIRIRMSRLTSEALSRRADRIGHGVTSGLAATDLAQTARAAAAGAVSTMIYDFTIEVLGQLDTTTGEISFDPEGYDLLSLIAVTVLARGGEVIAVRPDEISAQIWNGEVLAALRYPLV